MLTVNEFFAGEANTAKPISLIQPITDHEDEMLIAGNTENPIAIFLQGEHAFQWFEVAGSSNWTGLIIPNLSIEVDQTSAFNPNFQRNWIGAAVRSQTELTICVKAKGRNGTSNISVVSELPSLGDYKVGFNRWQLVLGDGSQKWVIRAFDLTQSAKP